MTELHPSWSVLPVALPCDAALSVLSPLRFDVRRNGEHAGDLIRLDRQWLLYLEGITTGEACRNFKSCDQVLRYLNRLA